MGRRDKSRSSSNWWANRKEPIPKRKNTYRHGEWRCEVEQHKKFSSHEIGRPSVDLQSTLASTPPMLLPVFARSMTPPGGNSLPATPRCFPSIGGLNGFFSSTPTAAPAADRPTSPSSPLWLPSLTPAVPYPKAHTSDTTSTSRL